MQLNQLKPNTKRVTKKRIGRGGTRGKTSGRGMKGQKARSGHSIRPNVRDIIKKLPKMRGRGVNSNKSFGANVVPVNLSVLEQMFSDGESVTPQTLVSRRVIRSRAGRAPAVKILGTGALTKKLTVSACAVSESARKHIETAGGSVQSVNKK